MKKLFIKAKIIDIPYSPAVEAVPATETEPAIEAIPEQLEVSHYEVIDQTQGQESELELWLAGNLAVGKYPEGYVVEWIDLEQDYDYKLAKCIEARISEYPTFGEFLNAYFDGGSPALDELREKRLEIKAKYPKPEQA